ncbi:MAG TPA: isoprenylcysteine carboxylmethyltransferase family protein [Candidatus Acidoferrales bacterium]|nr:isoprenylcysteine carboxylmethyltransferase family protein [Candidatus Acidoferrales bacterium]
MSQRALSSILLFTLSLLFLLVRLHFTIKRRREFGKTRRDENSIAREGKADFTFPRILIGPVIPTFILICAINPSWMRCIQFPHPVWGMGIGTVMTLGGIAFLAWTHACLGKEWSVSLQLRDDHRLIQSGPYARVRHPMYTSLFAIYIGLALVSNNYGIMLLVIMVVISLLLRVPKEEDRMIEKFGDECRDYILKTGRFFPRLPDVSLEKLNDI